MLGAVLREHYRAPESYAGKLRVVFVSIMPCTAKKDEIRRVESTTYDTQDVNESLTTIEVIRMLRDKKIDLLECEPEEPDVPYGTGSGGGEIFGVTGGVTEAALRYLMPECSQKELDAIASTGVRGQEGIREFSLSYQGKDLKIAVASGLGNADALMRRVRAGEHFDLIEIMSCPGGCVMGGGQPSDIYGASGLRRARTDNLYRSDQANQIRRANENPQIRTAFENVIGDREHTLLHRNFQGRTAARD
jgi:NADH-quinone oxidoreductase subunit G